MFDIVLYRPEIPPNTGNVVRLAANTDCRLHLIEPLGFGLDDGRLGCAGLDWDEYAELRARAGWAAARRALCLDAGSRLPPGAGAHADAAWQAGDALSFGPRARGLTGIDLGRICAHRPPTPADAAAQPPSQPLQRCGGGGVRGLVAARLCGRGLTLRRRGCKPGRWQWYSPSCFVGYRWSNCR